MSVFDVVVAECLEGRSQEQCSARWAKLKELEQTKSYTWSSKEDMVCKAFLFLLSFIEELYLVGLVQILLLSYVCCSAGLIYCNCLIIGHSSFVN